MAEEEAARKAAAAESLAARKAEEEKAARLATEIAAVNNDDVASDGALQYVGNFRITYYCSCEICCGKTTGRTSSGTSATQGRTIAVNPSQIPYGTHVIINGHEYIAEDSGVGSNQIDIYVNSHEEALKKGLSYSDVYIRK